jgi:hypothetical protein
MTTIRTDYATSKDGTDHRDGIEQERDELKARVLALLADRDRLLAACKELAGLFKRSKTHGAAIARARAAIAESRRT